LARRLGGIKLYNHSFDQVMKGVNPGILGVDLSLSVLRRPTPTLCLLKVGFRINHGDAP